MATTALTIDGKNFLFMTVPVPNAGVDVDIFTADEEFVAFGMASIGASHQKTEEEYHRDLRKQSKEKGQFVPAGSTNPEWNPEDPET
jgi:hypothetical protein